MLSLIGAFDGGPERVARFKGNCPRSSVIGSCYMPVSNSSDTRFFSRSVSPPPKGGRFFFWVWPQAWKKIYIRKCLFSGSTKPPPHVFYKKALNADFSSSHLADRPVTLNRFRIAIGGGEHKKRGQAGQNTMSIGLECIRCV